MKSRVAWPIAVLAIAMTAGASGSGVSTSSCPETISTSDPALQRSYAEFKRSLESSPLVLRLGRPASCAARAHDGSILVEYVSSKGAKLEAQHDPAIELTEQRLSETGLSRKSAVALLQRTERWAFGEKGCSIVWKESPAREAGTAPDSWELAYRGDVCNCQGRLVYTENALTSLIFRSAC
jgi:hypothetical protein